MDPVIKEIYTTILEAAPFVIIAYVLLFAVLLVYCVIATRGLKKTEKELAALEEAVEQLKQKA